MFDKVRLHSLTQTKMAAGNICHNRMEPKGDLTKHITFWQISW